MSGLKGTMNSASDSEVLVVPNKISSSQDELSQQINSVYVYAECIVKSSLSRPRSRLDSLSPGP